MEEENYERGQEPSDRFLSSPRTSWETLRLLPQHESGLLLLRLPGVTHTHQGVDSGVLLLTSCGFCNKLSRVNLVFFRVRR